MSGSGDTNNALDSLQADFDKAMSESDMVKRYRALITVVEGGQRLQTKVDRKLKEHQKSETYLEVEKRFVTKHETKLDALAQAFFRCYESPGKAREEFDKLCAGYDTNYVTEVVKLGVRRLAKPLGFDLLGIKSDARRLAEAAYEETLLPALEQIIPDQGDYLKLKSLNVEERYDTVRHEIEMGRQAISAVDARMKKFKKELETAAKSMSDEDVERLNVDERSERLMLLPAKMREAILEAEMEELKKCRAPR